MAKRTLEERIQAEQVAELRHRENAKRLKKELQAQKRKERNHRLIQEGAELESIYSKYWDGTLDNMHIEFVSQMLDEVFSLHASVTSRLNRTPTAEDIDRICYCIEQNKSFFKVE